MNYPTTWSYNGSQWVSATGPTYTYSFDAMDRPTGLKDQNNATAVSNVSYNPANQLLGITYFGTIETRQYNNLNQMTSLAFQSGFGTDTITYTFPPGTNNGKISQQSDSASGETVTYQYDSLNRLLSGTSNKGWSETYGYDGFGNLVSKTPTGGAPTLSQAVSATTNQIVGQSYDGNGNQTSSPLGPLAYDAENRMTGFSNGSTQYGYDSRNKRIWKATLVNGNMTQEVYFYGVDGQKLGTYSMDLALVNNVAPVMGDSATNLAVFFGGKRVGITTNGITSAFAQDRLGSAGSFYPYGEARGTPPADTVGFATYTHDSATGLDYADQRYYANNFGRFMSPDPYMSNTGGPGNPVDPGSWNRYAYVRGNPVNRTDPWGTCDDENGDNPDGCPDSGGGAGGGTGNPPGCSHLRAKGSQEPCPQSGGGGGNGPIKITKFSTTSKKAVIVQNDLRWLKAALQDDPICDTWLTNNQTVIGQALGDLPNQANGTAIMMVGVGNFSDSGINAVAGVEGTNLGPGTAAITINLNGAFFNSNVSVGYGVINMTGGSDAAQTLILLHELAHLTGASGFNQNDANDPAAQASNNYDVEVMCSKVLTMAGWK